MNKYGWKVGDLGVVVREDGFSVGSLVEFTKDDGTSSPEFTLIQGKCIEPFSRGGETTFEVYSHIEKIDKYFSNPLQPTDKELLCFNIIYGTNITKEDLCQR